MRLLLWKIRSWALATGNNSSRRIQIESMRYPQCPSMIKNDSHVFFDCEFAKKVWFEVGLWVEELRHHTCDWKDWVMRLVDLKEN